MSTEPDDTGDDAPARHPWRWAALVIGVLLVAAVVAAWLVLRQGDEESVPGLTFGWGGSEGHPSCVYDPKSETVDATIRIDGTAPAPNTVLITVTAYADENTSKPVGSGTRSVHVEGDVHTYVVVSMSVDKPPEVDIDGETACRLLVAE
jgi:hypothetical protein